MATTATNRPQAAADSAGASAAGEGLSREILVLGAVFVLGAIMTVLDLTIVNVAVPTIGRELGTSISSIQWVMTGYMLAFASVIPLTGWASERFGAKRVWTSSLLLFMLGSVLAGAAWSTASLIGFRVLQGIGAGMILPVGQTILAQAAGPQRMGRVMSVVGVPMLLGPILGNVIGGAIVDQVSWRWIFYINVPVGIVAVLAAVRLLPEAKPRLGERLDLRGLLLLSPGIALFLYGMTEAGNQGGFGRTRTIAAAAVGLALVALFIWHASLRGKTALIDLSLFRRRGFATAAALNFLLIGALFGSLLLLPLYYQLVRHETPLRVGLLLVPPARSAPPCSRSSCSGRSPPTSPTSTAASRASGRWRANRRRRARSPTPSERPSGSPSA
jgi:EmrB/QacA subfamily drug resistance transporter